VICVFICPLICGRYYRFPLLLTKLPIHPVVPQDVCRSSRPTCLYPFVWWLYSSPHSSWYDTTTLTRELPWSTQRSRISFDFFTLSTCLPNLKGPVGLILPVRRRNPLSQCHRVRGGRIWSVLVPLRTQGGKQGNLTGHPRPVVKSLNNSTWSTSSLEGTD
jgi:hypothetical protein